jgi:hypothetical protein
VEWNAVMAAVRLPEDILDQIASTLAETGGLAAHFPRPALHEPIALVPEETDLDMLENLEAGGVTMKSEADAELSLLLHFLRKRDGQLHSVICEDPWAQPGDLDYRGPPPEELVIIDGHVNYVYDLAEITQELIWEYQANAISFLRIIYVSELTTDQIRALAESDNEDPLHRLAHSIRHIVMSAYDGETWVIVNAGHAHR